MTDYYSDKLSAERLMRVYEIAPPRVGQYLKSEIDHVIKSLRPGDTILELGCGYGRALALIQQEDITAAGIDTSIANLTAARAFLSNSAIHLVQMNAVKLGFRDKSFDRVICIQNGISAFHLPPEKLVAESIRVTKPGGSALFSTYSHKFWDDRLEWFRLQAESSLIGEIDLNLTGDGKIVCKDGFSATTFGQEQFRSLAESFGLPYSIIEVDNSSLFLEINV